MTLAFLVLTVGFFLLTLALVYGCEHLRRGS